MKNINSLDIIKALINQEKSIQSIWLVEFNNYKLIQNRIEITEELENAFNSALDLRERYKLPFWDGFNVSLFDKKIKKFDFFDDILFHNTAKKEIIVQREKASNLSLSNLNGYTALSSKIKANNKIMHLPLLDFHIPVSDKNTEISKNVIAHLGLKGNLLDSGKSYHFVGSRLLEENEMKNLLYKALLFAPIIDRAWISHQLIQGYCCLRLSKKYDRSPYLISKID